MARAAQETRQGVIVFLRDRVELVIMTTGTGDREAQEGLGDHIDLVVDPPHLVLADVHRRMRSLAEEIKTAAEDRLVVPVCQVSPGLIKQVARNLFHHEPVVGQVGVERTDDVVAIAKRIGDVVVELVPVGLGVADQIEPVAGPPFAVARTCQEPVNEPLVGAGRGVGQERGNIGGRRRKPRQVEAQAAYQCALIGLGGRHQPTLVEGCQDESVDRVSNPAGKP